MTVREAILEAMLSALNTGRPTGVPVVAEGRHRNVQPAQMPAMTLFPVDEQLSPIHSRRSPLVASQMVLVLELWGAGSVARTSSRAIEPMAAWVVRALAGQTLGGLATAVYKRRLRYQYGQSGKTPVCLGRLEVVVEYTSRANNDELAV